MTMTSRRRDRPSDNEGEQRPTDARARPALMPITVRVLDAAQMLGISRSRLYELIDTGDIETVKLGRSTLIPVDSLYALLDRLRHEQASRE